MNDEGFRHIGQYSELLKRPRIFETRTSLYLPSPSGCIIRFI